jgi:cell division protein FtsB
MITRQRKKSFVNRLWMPLLAVAFLSYFGFHAFDGYYGIRSSEQIAAETVRLTTERDRLKQERQELERRVAALRPEQLDADMVDVEARLALNRMRADEVVIHLGATQQNPD